MDRRDFEQRTERNASPAFLFTLNWSRLLEKKAKLYENISGPEKGNPIIRHFTLFSFPPVRDGRMAIQRIKSIWESCQ
jgi:hypothetical protein